MASQEFSRATCELERVFGRLAVVLLFRQQMPTPIITIQSKGRRKALGWFIRKAWTNDGENYVPEINISAEYLSRPVIEIVATLVHEMVHLSNFMAGIRDCSSTNYHNRRFKELAESVLLTCERVEDGINQFGWAYTAASPALCDIINNLEIDEDAFAFHRDLQLGFAMAGKARQKSDEPAEPKMKKWSCGCTNVWSAVAVDAVCFKPECGRPFRRSAVFH